MLESPKTIVDPTTEDELATLRRAMQRFAPEVVRDLRRMAATIASLRTDNDRMAMELAKRPRVASKPSDQQFFMVLVTIIALGAGWPLAFVLYVQRYAFDSGAVPYFVAMIGYFCFIGVSGVSYIRGKRK